MSDRPEFYAVYFRSPDDEPCMTVWMTLKEAKKHALKLVDPRAPCRGTPRIARFEGEWVT
jgi:hypothetical protein